MHVEAQKDHGVKGQGRLERLNELVTKLHKNRRPFCAVFSSEDLVERWTKYLAKLCESSKAGSIGFPLKENLGVDTTFQIVKTLSSANLFCVVSDFTSQLSVAYEPVRISFQLNIPTIVMSQSIEDIPVGFYPIDPIVYSNDDLGLTGTPLATQLSLLLEQLALRCPLQACNALLKQELFELVVMQAFRVLEGALWYLTDRVRRDFQVEPLERRPHKMSEFLADHADKYGLTIDCSPIGQYTRLRNNVVHNETFRASRAEAVGIMHFTEDFIRFNLGPNLRGFDR